MERGALAPANGAQGVTNPVPLLVAALPLNFSAVLAILLARVVVMTGWDVGPMREGTGVVVAQTEQAALPMWTVPAAMFLLACFIAFSTGTSWGTFAIMIPIVIPMVEILDLHPWGRFRPVLGVRGVL